MYFLVIFLQVPEFLTGFSSSIGGLRGGARNPFSSGLFFEIGDPRGLVLNGILGPDLGDSVYCVVVDFTVRAKANLDLDRFYNPRSGKVVVCRAFLRALKSEPFVGNSVLTCAVIGFSRAESPIKTKLS